MAKKSTVQEALPVATSVFLFDSLKMDKSLYWDLKIAMKTILPEGFREYTVKLSLNEEPFNMRIEDLQNRLAVIKDQKQLFSAEQKKEMSDIEDQIEEVKDEMKEMLEITPAIEFETVITKIEWKNGDTIFTMNLPAEQVNEFNDNRSKLSTYKIELYRK